VKTSDIYLGALPWVGLQLLLVGILIFYPEIVTGMLDKPLTGNLDAVEIRVEEPPGDPGAAAPGEGASQPGAAGGEGGQAPAPDPADYFNRK
jgi:hypothetical protein